MTPSAGRVPIAERAEQCLQLVRLPVDVPDDVVGHDGQPYYAPFRRGRLTLLRFRVPAEAAIMRVVTPQPRRRGAIAWRPQRLQENCWTSVATSMPSGLAAEQQAFEVSAPVRLETALLPVEYRGPAPPRVRDFLRDPGPRFEGVPVRETSRQAWR